LNGRDNLLRPRADRQLGRKIDAERKRRGRHSQQVEERFLICHYKESEGFKPQRRVQL
jgi:hypothetical protein